jgi:hypothetical protein
VNVTFIGGEAAVWRQITKAAKSASRADVAVAYFGEGGAKRLPLKPGSRLVVDASEATVKGGATCPSELLVLSQRGVDVHSRPNLHAKVFVFPKKAYVGSANNTTPAASRLAEAMLRTTDRRAIRQAREFVLSMCDRLPLGPQELRQLQDAYERRPRKRPVAGARKLPGVAFWLDEYEVEDYPKGSRGFVRECVAEARRERRIGRGYHIEETWKSGDPRYREGDTLILLNVVGPTEMMEAPGKVIKVKQWSNGRRRYTFTILEQRKQRRANIALVAKSLGYGWRKRLMRRGKLPMATGYELVAWWNQRG